jgi:hypothetical protein
MTMLPTEPTEPVTDLSKFMTGVYGPPKIGKSTFCSQAPDALFLDTEGGLLSLKVHRIPISDWTQMGKACAEIATTQHKFRTIVIDTLDNAYLYCTKYMCDKVGIDHPSDMDYGKGWALVNNEFHRLMAKLKLLSIGTIWVSHAQDVEIKGRVKYTKTVPTLTKSAREIMLKLTDITLLADTRTVNDKGDTERILRTKHHNTNECGDRTGRLPATLPLDWNAFEAAFKGESE